MRYRTKGLQRLPKQSPRKHVDWSTNVEEEGKRLRCKECKHIGAKITISGRGDRRIRPEMSFSAYTELFAGVLQSATTARFIRSACYAVTGRVQERRGDAAG